MPTVENAQGRSRLSTRLTLGAAVLFALAACAGPPPAPQELQISHDETTDPIVGASMFYGGGSELAAEQIGSLAIAVSAASAKWGADVDGLAAKVCVFVSGFADRSEGASVDGVALSVARAMAVANWVHANGGARFRIEVMGHGAVQHVFSGINFYNMRAEAAFLPCNAWAMIRVPADQR